MIELGTVQQFLLAAAMFAGIGALLVSAIARPLLRSSQHWAPERRHRALVLVAILPPVLAATGIVSVTLPSLLGGMWPELDHCLSHGGHAHLCFVHGTRHSGDALAWCALGIAGAWQLTRVGRSGIALHKAATTVRGLMRSARRDPERGYWVVASARPLCASVGLLRPRLIISEGLLEQLGETDLEVIIAHEQAHERRRDSLVRLAARASTAFVAPGVRRKLLAALEASAEHACDERAAASTGDRLAVAEAILTVERKLETGGWMPGNAFVMGFGGSSVVARVDALLEPARRGGSFKLLAAFLAAVVATMLGGFEQVHHITESVLGHIGH